MIAIYVQKTQARAELDAPVTSGSSGRGVEFRFSDDWDSLTKTAIFETDNYKDSKQIPESGVTTIPDSVLEYPGFQLRVGVYGKSAGGDVVTPTVYADCGTIKRGANTTPVGTPPTPSQAEALQKQIDVLSSRFDVWVAPGELEDVVSVDFTPVNLGDTATGKIASNGTHAVVTLTSSIVVNVAAGEELEIATIPEGFEPVTSGFVPYNAGKFALLKVKLSGGKVYLVNDTEENVATGKLPSTATFAYALKNPNITELTDIRVGYDGTIYETAGDAVREQIKEAISVASTGVSPDVIKEAVEEYLSENDITAGKDGVGIASILQTAATTADGGRNVFTVTLTNGTTENFIVHNGNKGSPGKDGTSVTVESVSESAVDGGSNVVTFSDGKTLTVKNGSSGSVELDTTLTQSGKAADAKAVGDALANVGGDGFSTDEKTVILSLLNNAIYTTDMTEALAQLESYWNGSGGSGDSGGGDDTGGDTPPVVETLPSWIAEMQVIEFTPEADTNTAQTFAISMENEPNMVFVNSDIETPNDIRDLAALTFVKTPNDSIFRVQYAADKVTTIFGSAEKDVSSVVSISASEIVLATSNIGGTAAYWRAGHTYKIYCVKTVFDTTDMAHIPGFAKEVYPVVFSPESDTNEAQTFSYEMENEPNAILIISDLTEIIAYRDFVGMFVSARYDDIAGTWRGFQITNNNGNIGGSIFGGTGYGVTACGNGSMTFQTGNQGGTPSKWKAGYNYLILFMVL